MITNSNISSEHVLVFPAGRRQGDQNLNGTLITESRLSSIVNGILDVSGFVITPPGTNLSADPATGDSILEMNILGRYIRFNSSTNISGFLGLDSGNYAFAGISIDSSNGGIIFEEIDGSDNSSTDNYDGVTIVCSDTDVTPVENDNVYIIGGKTCVKIGENISGSWIVPDPEFPKISYIDGGTI